MDWIYRSAKIGKDPDWDWYDDLLVTYFELICDLKKDKQEEQIIAELRTRKDQYPIERCIEICEWKELKLPRAYLLTRDGRCEESITLFIEVLESIVIKTNDLFQGIPIFKATEDRST